MSRATFQTTSYDVNETPSLSSASNKNAERSRTLRFHHRLMPTISSSNRSHETLPIVVVQSSSSTTTDSSTKTTTTSATQHKSVVRLNPSVKRNLRGKRRSTGIRPDDVSLASAINEITLNEDDDEEDKPNPSSQFITITPIEPSESFEPNRTSPPKPVFKVSRIQPTFNENSHRSFETLTLTRTDPFVKSPQPSSSSSNLFSNNSTKFFRPEEFILRRQASDEDSSSLNRRHIQDRIRLLESLSSEKDVIIQDLQRKLEQTTRELNDAQQQIYILQRDKLTLIKTLATIQESKSSPTNATGGDLSTKRTGFITRN